MDVDEVIADRADSHKRATSLDGSVLRPRPINLSLDSSVVSRSPDSVAPGAAAIDHREHRPILGCPSAVACGGEPMTMWSAMLWELSEATFAMTVRSVFDQLHDLGFHTLEPLVYGCSYARDDLIVQVTYERRRCVVRTLLRHRFVTGDPVCSPVANFVAVLALAEAPVARQLQRVLDDHYARIQRRLRTTRPRRHVPVLPGRQSMD